MQLYFFHGFLYLPTLRKGAPSTYNPAVFFLVVTSPTGGGQGELDLRFSPAACPPAWKPGGNGSASCRSCGRLGCSHRLLAWLTLLRQCGDHLQWVCLANQHTAASLGSRVTCLQHPVLRVNTPRVGGRCMLGARARAVWTAGLAAVGRLGPADTHLSVHQAHLGHVWGLFGNLGVRPSLGAVGPEPLGNDPTHGCVPSALCQAHTSALWCAARSLPGGGPVLGSHAVHGAV